MRNVGQLAELREKIAAIEKRPLLAEGAALLPRQGGAGWPRFLPQGVVQEIFADEERDGGAALGFALGLAQGLLTDARKAVLFLQLRHASQELGLPYGPGLTGFGLGGGEVSLVRLTTLPEWLWAIDEALACRAVAAVLAEIQGAPKALDFTVSRRLSLRAANAGASVFLLRYGRSREASAARLRWRIGPAQSQPPPFDDRAPGAPRWQVVLEKGRLAPGQMEAGLELMLDWTENGFAAVSAGTAGGGQGGIRPAAPGPQPAALGHRLSQAG